MLSTDDPRDRIRAVFGLAHDMSLPSVDQNSILVYYEYLSASLIFPFLADLRQTEESQPMPHGVTVLGLVKKSRVTETQGILCHVEDESGKYNTELAEIQVDPGRPNRRLIEDYSYWFLHG